MRELQALAASLSAQNGGRLQGELQKLAEAFRYSDPVSSDATAELENELKCVLEDLRQALARKETEAADALCKKALGSLNERNRLCAMNK